MTIKTQEKGVAIHTVPHHKLVEQAQIIITNITKINSELAILSKNSSIIEDSIKKIYNKMMFNTLLMWRKRILIASLLLGGALCVYFIFNVRNYEISWNLLNWLMLAVANKINNLLRSTGTLILILPLPIIIVSFLFPSSIPLKLMSEVH